MNVTRILSLATVLSMGLLSMACPRRDRSAREGHYAAPPPPPPSETTPQPQPEMAPQPQGEVAPQPRPQDDQARGEAMTAAGARRRLIQARCEYEQRCGRIGPGRQFSSLTACTDAVAAEWRGALFQTCPEGVNTGELNQCIAAFTSHDCGKAPGKPADIKQCDPNRICASGTH